MINHFYVLFLCISFIVAMIGGYIGVGLFKIISGQAFSIDPQIRMTIIATILLFCFCFIFKYLYLDAESLSRIIHIKHINIMLISGVIMGFLYDKISFVKYILSLPFGLIIAALAYYVSKL